MSDSCPDCRGTGFRLHSDASGVRTAVRCLCAGRDADQRLLRAARIPPRYEHCTIEEFRPQHASHEAALKAASKWLELWPSDEAGGLLFVGPPGTGKTHLAVAIAREAMRHKGARVLFYEQRALLKALQGTYDVGATLREVEVLAPVLESEVLVLDDLGAGRTTAWARDVLHDVISQRYNERRSLILTSNLRIADERVREARSSGTALELPLDLGDRLGDALMSRLHEMCRIVKMGGRDFRVDVGSAQLPN